MQWKNVINQSSVRCVRHKVMLPEHISLLFNNWLHFEILAHFTFHTVYLRLHEIENPENQFPVTLAESFFWLQNVCSFHFIFL